MNPIRFVKYIIIFSLLTFPFSQALAQDGSDIILKDILLELKEIKNELKNSLIIQNKYQLILQQIEYQRQLLNQNTNTEDSIKKEIDGIETSNAEVKQRMEEIRNEMSSKVINSNPDSTGANAEYNNLVTISEQQQKQLGSLRIRLAEISNNIAEINRAINELLVKYKNTIQPSN